MLVTDVFEDIFQNFESNDQSLPSLPDIALRVHTAASDPNCNFDSIGKVIKSDAALSSHLIRMANSPLYKSRVPVSNVRSAVHRIGVPGARSFATTFALQNLFHSYSTGLNRLFREVWMESCEISALTAVLATFCAGFDPDDALLAGLLQDIGMVVLLGQLADYGEDLPDPAGIRAGLSEWSPAIGKLLLESWEFDQRYIDVVTGRHEWQRDENGAASLADIVTLARLHHYAVSNNLQGCPPIAETPAFRKLPIGTVSERGSLRALDDAVEEIGQIRKMLLG